MASSATRVAGIPSSILTVVDRGERRWRERSARSREERTIGRGPRSAPRAIRPLDTLRRKSERARLESRFPDRFSVERSTPLDFEDALREPTLELDAPSNVEEQP